MRPSLVTCHVEFHDSVNQGKEGVVFADANILPRMNLCTVLSYDDASGLDGLSAVYLDAEPLALRVPAVP